MKIAAAMTALSIAAFGAVLIAQETKPVPKDSIRVTVSGCAKGYVFTAGPRVGELPDTPSVPEGTHLRMNGPKKLISEIDGYKDSMITLVGIMKKGQEKPGGINLGGGVRIAPSAPPSAGGTIPANMMTQPPGIDVEGWSPAVGSCR